LEYNDDCTFSRHPETFLENVLEGGTKRTYQKDDWKKDFQDHCAAKVDNNLLSPALRRAHFAHRVGSAGSRKNRAAFIFSCISIQSFRISECIADSASTKNGVAPSPATPTSSLSIQPAC
jgi:hypothetical protein